MKKDFLTSSERLAIYGHHYKIGWVEPHYPLPVVNTMCDSYGNHHSAARWMDNFDNFWTDQHGARGFSL